RYAEAVRFARALPGRHGDFEAVVDAIEQRYGHLHWVHVLNNAALVVAALVYGAGDFERSITAVVSGGWDTDSNGATVGSITGALTGASGLPQRWTAPLRNRVTSTLSGFDGTGCAALARRTLAVAERREIRQSAAADSRCSAAPTWTWSSPSTGRRSGARPSRDIRSTPFPVARVPTRRWRRPEPVAR